MKTLIGVLSICLLHTAAFAQDGSEETPINVDIPQALAHVEQGKAKYQAGDYRSAVMSYDKALELHQGLVEAYFQRASAKNLLKDYEGALQDYDHVITLDSLHVYAYYYRSDLKHQLGFERASSLQDINVAISIAPENAQLYAHRAYIKSRTLDLEINKINHDDAIADLDKAISLDPNIPEYYRQRGFSKSQQGATLSAAEDFDKAIGIDPKNAENFNDRGLIRLKIEDFKGAASDFSKAIELTDDLEYLYRNRGLARYNNKNPSGAVQDYARAIALISEELRVNKFDRSYKYKLTNAYIMRGASFISMRNNYEACADFSKAYELGEKRALNYLKKYCRP